MAGRLHCDSLIKHGVVVVECSIEAILELCKVKVTRESAGATAVTFPDMVWGRGR